MFHVKPEGCLTRAGSWASPRHTGLSVAAEAADKPAFRRDTPGLANVAVPRGTDGYLASAGADSPSRAAKRAPFLPPSGTPLSVEEPTARANAPGTRPRDAPASL